MKGVRPLSISEIHAVANSFDGKYAVRNKSLFMLGVSCGGRISALLQFYLNDLYQNGTAVTDLHFDKGIVKGGKASRYVPLNADGRVAINELVAWHIEYFGVFDAERPAFPSRNTGRGIISMTRRNAHNILRDAFNAAGLNGKLATHSLRKSYAQRLYEHTGDIFCVQQMLGHKSVSTTQRYLGVDYRKVRQASEVMSLHQYEVEATDNKPL